MAPGREACLGLYVLAHELAAVAGWFEFASKQRAHLQKAEVLGPAGYVWYWAEWTLQNWQSEFLELGVIVVLSSFLIHKGSAESKDSDDEIKELLESIESKLDQLERRR